MESLVSGVGAYALSLQVRFDRPKWSSAGAYESPVFGNVLIATLLIPKLGYT